MQRDSQMITASGQGIYPAVVKLLLEKQGALARLEETLSLREREELERSIERIDRLLNSLDRWDSAS